MEPAVRAVEPPVSRPQAPLLGAISLLLFAFLLYRFLPGRERHA